MVATIAMITIAATVTYRAVLGDSFGKGTAEGVAVGVTDGVDVIMGVWVWVGVGGVGVTIGVGAEELMAIPVSLVEA